MSRQFAPIVLATNPCHCGGIRFSLGASSQELSSKFARRVVFGLFVG